VESLVLSQLLLLLLQNISQIGCENRLVLRKKEVVSAERNQSLFN